MTFRLFLFLQLGLPAMILAADLVQRAGNTHDDRERQTLLQKLATSQELGQERRQEAASLAEFVRKWNGGSLKFYGASMRGKPH